MEYPEGFPEHLKRKVDVAIHAAEIEFIDAKESLDRSRFESEAERLILKYAESVFFGFATQAVEAGRERVWDGERIRRELEKFQKALGHAYFDKHPDPSGYHRSEGFRDQLTKQSKNWKGWRAIHEGLRQVAELPFIPPEIAPPEARSHRGHRAQVRKWMAEQGLENVEQASRRLGLSKSALKSIMSDKGSLRYSQATLNRVLKEIGYVSEPRGE